MINRLMTIILIASMSLLTACAGTELVIKDPGYHYPSQSNTEVRCYYEAPRYREPVIRYDPRTRTYRRYYPPIYNHGGRHDNRRYPSPYNRNGYYDSRGRRCEIVYRNRNYNY